MAKLFLALLILAWIIAWVCSLYSVLARSGLDATTKLVWVVMLIFVPVLGVLFYWILGARFEGPFRFSHSARFEARASAPPPSTCWQCQGRIPEGASACPACGVASVRI
jgi:hypothetical protein